MSRRESRPKAATPGNDASNCCRWKAASAWPASPNRQTGTSFSIWRAIPFVGEHGLEYLFGYLAADEKGQLEYHGDWAFSRADEKRAFEQFVDFVMRRWEACLDLHVYHYAPYETAALKRLMGRYATREEEIDQMLRAGLFVDLYQVVRRGVRASVESYSIKRLEPFYEFEREVPLSDAESCPGKTSGNPRAGRRSLGLGGNQDRGARVQQGRLPLGRWPSGLAGSAAGAACRRWYGNHPSRCPGDGAPTERISDWQIKINELVERLER